MNNRIRFIRKRRLNVLVAWFILLQCLVAPAAIAQVMGANQDSREKAKPPSQSAAGEHQHHATNKEAGVPVREPISRRIPDSMLVNQDGRSVRFYSDLVLGRVVVINFIFTSCNLVCPMLGNSFSKLQDALGERLGRDVSLITITTDPKTDTPEQLRAWATRFGAKQGWTLATGDIGPIDELLLALTGTKSGRGEHNPGILIINDRTGAMIRGYGLGDPQKLIKAIDATRDGGD